MKTKAAVAWKAGAPLTIEEVDLAGPRDGEVLAEAGAQISPWPFRRVTGRKGEGSAFGGARGRTDVPRRVDGYLGGKLNIDDLITHQPELDEINQGFELMKRGESIRSVVIF